MKQAPITLNKLTSKRTWKVIISWILTIAILCGVAMLAVAVIRYVDGNEKAVVSIWKRGELNATTGVYSEAKTSIYTKEMFECDGLDITVDFDGGVKYKVFFYDEDKDLLSTNGVTTLSNAHFESTSVPATAKYARVLITPDDDSSISLFEIAKYANAVHITVDR